MSKDKSKLKAVLREAPLSTAIELVAPGERYSRAHAVRTLFDDGSIRFSSIASSMSGADVYESFARSIDAGFVEYPRAHTFVLCFDDKRHVPSRKSSTQAGRREALAASIARKGVREWAWDGVSPIVERTSHEQLPPWDRVRLDSHAYRHALGDVVAALLAHYVPPPGRRLIVDSSGGARVLESSIDGVVLEPYVDRVPKPRIGEADIAAQHYARRALLGDDVCRLVIVDEHEHEDEAEEAMSRSLVALHEEHEHYYADLMSDVPLEQRVHPARARQQFVPCECRRRVYEPGDVVLRSTDTDFVPLGLVIETTTTKPTPSDVRVHVSLGTAHVNASGTYCTSSAPDARAHVELYDMSRLAAVVRRLHSDATPPSCMQSIWSFVAFCAACGNDYTRRLHGFSHQTMFAAYKHLVADDRLVGDDDVARRPPLLDASAFCRFVRIAYFTRLAERNRPVSWTDDVPTYAELRAAVAASTSVERNHMPDLATLTRYFEQVCWSLFYASVAVDGIEHVPEPMQI